jgi:hypothetical protein
VPDLRDMVVGAAERYQAVEPFVLSSRSPSGQHRSISSAADSLDEDNLRSIMRMRV